MGVKCEINLAKTADDVFKPGDIVSGVIRYTVDEDTTFSRITVALKGVGKILLRELIVSNARGIDTRKNEERYVNMSDVILDNKNGVEIATGTHEAKFEFTLPDGIPSSLCDRIDKPELMITTNIFYFVRIKFERPGLLKFAKRFNKEFIVASWMKPKLPMEPTAYSERKLLRQLFSSKESVVVIKVIVAKPVLNPGENLCFNYEITNDATIEIKGVQTKFIEKFRFIPETGKDKRIKRTIGGGDYKTGIIKPGAIQHMNFLIPIPQDRTTLDFSKIVKRNYFIVINVELPLPHRDMKLEIPVEIGPLKDLSDDQEENAVALAVDAPPPYWEVMNEINNENSNNH